MSILRSARFAGDGTLTATAAEQLRLAVLDTAPYPAPVLSSGPAVAKIQHSLIDLGCALQTFGAEGRFRPETGGAVARYKSERGISPLPGSPYSRIWVETASAIAPGPADGRHSHG
jgi:peptidoglycan hydrolase-like protein with peptidoglycan-binding domain